MVGPTRGVGSGVVDAPGSVGRKPSTAQCRKELLRLAEEKEDAEEALGKLRNQLMGLKAEHEALAAAHQQQQAQLQEAQQERDSTIRRLHSFQNRQQQDQDHAQALSGDSGHGHRLQREVQQLTQQLKEQQELAQRQVAADRDLLETYKSQLQKAAAHRAELEEARAAQASLKRQLASLELQLQRMPHLEAQLDLFREEAKHEASLKLQALKELEDVQKESAQLRKDSLAAQLAVEEESAQEQRLHRGILSKLESALKELQQENEDLRCQLSDSQRRIDALGARLAEAKEVSEERREQAEALELQLRTRAADDEAEARGRRGRLAKAEREAEERGRQAEALEGRVRDLEERVESAGAGQQSPRISGSGRG